MRHMSSMAMFLFYRKDLGTLGDGADFQIL